MFYYIKRFENSQFFIVSEKEVPHIESPVNKFKKYKVLLEGTSTPFDAYIVFFHESIDGLKEIIAKQRPSLPPSSLINSASDLTDLDVPSQLVDAQNINKKSQLEKKLFDLKTKQIRDMIDAYNENESSVSMDTDNTNDSHKQSSSSSSTETEEVAPAPQRKRYKQYLYSKDAESQVSRRTLYKWKLMQITSSSAVQIGLADKSGSSALNSHVDCILNEQHESSNDQILPQQSLSEDCEEFLQDEDFNNKVSVHISSIEEQENDVLSDDTNSLLSETSEIESNDESGLENDFCEKEQYAFFNRVMFDDSKVTVRDVVLLISAFSLRFHLSDEGKLALADMLKFCAGPNFNSLNLSTYMMSKCFSLQEKNITYYYYCSQCMEKIVYSTNACNAIKKQSIICDKCQKKNNIEATSKDYFVSINLAYQIEQLLSNKILFDDILTNARSKNTSNTNIRDVHDSKLYKRAIQYNNTKEFEHILTLNFNTDGAPLTKSGKRGFWPVQVNLNDLSPKLRFKFTLLTGLLLVEKEPKSSLLNLYLLKVFVEQINNLYTEGITVEFYGRKYVFKFRVHSAVVDSVCRPIVQNRIQFNGYSGCSWCYQLGLYIPDVHGIRYVFEQENVIRTKESHEEDVKSAEMGIITRGVKGCSSLNQLDNFDMVWSFAYEYMHGLLLGVTHQIWNEWKSGQSEFKISKKNVEYIEQRYLCITPTHEIHRLPRKGILQGTSKPKASELRSWLLINSLPCLNGILHDDALTHYALLVKSAYTLMKTEITEQELLQCEKDLLQFVCYYEIYYGQGSMTFNVHCLLHLVESVRQTGPLYANSAFSFEGNIYTLKTYINGTKGMDRQMARKHMQAFIFKVGNTSNLSSSENIVNYCTNLFTPKRLSTFYEISSEILTFFGKSQLIKVNEIGECLMYKKCIFKSSVYHSIKYSRAKKTDDTVVQIASGEYGRILDILKVNNECFLHLRLFDVFPDYPFQNISHIRKIKCENKKNKHVISINNVKQKVILVNARNSRYLCTLPNTVEIQ